MPVPPKKKKRRSGYRPFDFSRSWHHLSAPETDGRFHVGTRMTFFYLLKDTKRRPNAFLGTIEGLEAEQDGLPYKLFTDYWFSKSFGTRTQED